MRRMENVSCGRAGARGRVCRELGSWAVTGTRKSEVAALASRGTPTLVRWVRVIGVADAIERVISLQQGGWPIVAAASRAQHAFVSQEPIAMPGPPVAIRIATAMKSVRTTFANLCTASVIPDRRWGVGVVNCERAIDIRRRRHTLWGAAYAWRLAGLILGAEERGNQLSDGLPPSGVNPARSW